MVSAGAIRAGRADVELGLDKTKFQKELGGIGRDLQKVGKNLAIGGAALVGFGTAILAPLGKAVKDFAAVGDQLDKMSKRTGVAVEQLSALKFAAEQSGSSLEAIEKSFKALSTFTLDAQRGLSTQLDTLKFLNLELQDLKGLDPGQLFLAYAEAIAKVPDETIRAGLAAKVFGRASQELIPLFKEGAKGMAALVQEARDLGIVMSTEDAVAAAEITDELNRLSKTFDQIKIEVGSVLAPILTKFSAETLRPLVKDTVDWVSRNGEAIVSIGKIGVAAVAIGGSLATLGFAVSGVGTALVFLSKSAKVAAISMHALAITPLGAALIAIGVTVGALTGQFEPLLEKLREFIGLAERAQAVAGKNPFAGITNAQAGTPNALNRFSTEQTPALDTPAMRDARFRRQFPHAFGEASAPAAAGPPGLSAPGQALLASSRQMDIARRGVVKVEIEIDTKSRTAMSAVAAAGKALQKQTAEQREAMEEERVRRQDLAESLMADIAAANQGIASQEQMIAEQRDNADLITQSAAAGQFGLGTQTIDRQQLKKLDEIEATQEEMKNELIKIRKVLEGDL